MKYSEIKEIKEICPTEWRDAVLNMKHGFTDFVNDDYRFIRDTVIDQVQQDELESDEYILGCFNDWFISDVTGIDYEAIQAMQKAEAYEGIGKLIISLGKLPELQQEYVSADGYGHHFATYDGEEIETGNYHAFKIN